MNVDDAKAPELQGDRLEAIFARQKELHEEYMKIESTIGLGLIAGQEWNINNRVCQAVLKDYAWRVTEELAEACDSIDISLENSNTHFKEEVMDALHFYVEMLIMMGMESDDMHLFQVYRIQGKDKLETFMNEIKFDPFMIPAHEKDSVRRACWKVVEEIGLAMNCLKQKPWKQTHVLTDEVRLKRHLQIGFWKLLTLCVQTGFTPESVYDLYMRKSEVNKFRQRSQY